MFLPVPRYTRNLAGAVSDWADAMVGASSKIDTNSKLFIVTTPGGMVLISASLDPTGRTSVRQLTVLFFESERTANKHLQFRPWTDQLPGQDVFLGKAR